MNIEPARRPARSILHLPSLEEIMHYASPAGVGGHGWKVGSAPAAVVSSFTPVTYGDFQLYDDSVEMQANGTGFTPASQIREGGPGGVLLATTFINSTTIRAFTLGAYRTASMFKTTGSKPFDVVTSGVPSNAANITVANWSPAGGCYFTGNASEMQRDGNGHLTTWLDNGTGGAFFNMTASSNNMTVTDNDPELPNGTLSTIALPGNRHMTSTHNISSVLPSNTTYTILSVARWSSDTFYGALYHHAGNLWMGYTTATGHIRCEHAADNGVFQTLQTFTSGAWYVMCQTYADPGDLGGARVRMRLGRQGFAPVTSQSANGIGNSSAGNSQVLRMGLNVNSGNYVTGKIVEYYMPQEQSSDRKLKQYVNFEYVRHGFTF